MKDEQRRVTKTLHSTVQERHLALRTAHARKEREKTSVKQQQGKA
jgi:hypothetical protein